MKRITLFAILIALLSSVVQFSSCKPLDAEEAEPRSHIHKHGIKKRFINPLFALGSPEEDDITKIRAKRSEEDCEKLQLCKLHARSSYSFFAAYELYFVNKENARLWDHRAHSVADCERRFSDCYEK